MDKSKWTKEMWDIYHHSLSKERPNPYHHGSVRWNLFEDAQESFLPEEEHSHWQNNHGTPWTKEGSEY